MPGTPSARFWSGLPPEARRILARGSTGREQLTALASAILPLAAASGGNTRAERCALAQEALVSAWAESPLDGSLARLAGGQPLPGWPALPRALGDALAALASFWKPPAENDPWWSATRREERMAALPARQAGEPKNLFWKAEAWSLSWLAGEWTLMDEALRPEAWARTLAPVRQLALAWRLLAGDEPAGALAALGELEGFLPSGAAGLRAECLLRLGRGDEAVGTLAQALAQSPWRTSLLLRLSDLASGAAHDVRPVPGGVAILLYTWNKARELDETLACLAASDLQGAGLWVLDNGSTDETPRVLEQWGPCLGGALTVLRLPVNIGAPAARNWLLSLPEVRARDFLVFLDDDVTLPPDWLGRLGAAASRCPEASVWGCRVVDAFNPLVVQSVDYTPFAPRSSHDPEQLLVLPTAHLSGPDLGQHAYLRPCVSVTGCCHLLREADISRAGGFDIRFSPSQYDDLERDLRVLLSGGHAAYQGHLCIRHKRRSGQLAERSAAEIGGATANAHKLQTKHREEDFRTVQGRGEDLLERDMEGRYAALNTNWRNFPVWPRGFLSEEGIALGRTAQE